jgi:hypothetical protein
MSFVFPWKILHPRALPNLSAALYKATLFFCLIMDIPTSYFRKSEKNIKAAYQF